MKNSEIVKKIINFYIYICSCDLDCSLGQGHQIRTENRLDLLSDYLHLMGIDWKVYEIIKHFDLVL